jgi:hypothetical protein
VAESIRPEVPGDSSVDIRAYCRGIAELSHRTANLFVHRKMRREFYRAARQRRRWHELYDPPFVKLGYFALTLIAWLIVSAFLVTITPPIIKAIIIGFWVIVVAFVTLLTAGPLLARRRKPITATFPDPAPVPTKLCPGPLDDGKSPCNKNTQIGMAVERCDHFGRLRPDRLK